MLGKRVLKYPLVVISQAAERLQAHARESLDLRQRPVLSALAAAADELVEDVVLRS